IRLTDRTGDNAAQLGNDTLELAVRENLLGTVTVQLRQLDYSTNTPTLLGSVSLDPALIGTGAQIVLHLTHSANSQTVGASFDLFNAQNQSLGSFIVPATGVLFHGETWTRAQFFASAPDPTLSFVTGPYGTLSIDSSGQWTYSLNNASPLVQALAQ